MTRCRMLVLGVLFIHAVCAQNPYLSGYKNDHAAFYADQTRAMADNPFLQHAIRYRQLPSYMAPLYLPPVERQQLICSGQQVCVNRNACQNGYFTQGSAGQRQECDINTEVCCAYRPPPPPPPPPTPVPSTPCSGSNNVCVPPNLCVGGKLPSNAAVNPASSSGKCYAPEVCCRVPDSTELTNEGYVVRVPPNPLIPKTPITPPPRPPTPPRPPIPTYLPPQKQPPPPRRGEDQLSPPIFRDTPVTHVPSRCAAALNCTEVQFCTSTGVISKTPVILTKEQETFRVPLTDCRDESKGIAAGKCCRDPDYVDPWPITQLGTYKAEFFGDTGKYNPNNGRQPVAQPTVLSGSSILSLPIPAPQTNQVTYDYPKPSATQCANRNRNAQPLGEGPYDAAFGEYPWQAMVLLESTKSLLCSGAIISEDMVATAAHCVQGRKPFDILVKAGEWKLGRDEEPLGFELVRITKIEIHPKFEPSTLSNDMALLHLENKVKLNTHIQPICIEDREPSPSDECVTTGWGKVALRLHAQDAIMHHSPVEIRPSNECQQGQGSKICGKPYIDACELDVGSALACSSNGRYVMKGTYSAEGQCGESVVSFTKPDTQWINAAKGKKPQYLPPKY